MPSIYISDESSFNLIESLEGFDIFISSGALRLAFSNSNHDERIGYPGQLQTLPWFSGPPTEEGEYFLVVEIERWGDKSYEVTYAYVEPEFDSWRPMKQASSEHDECIEEKYSLDDVIGHFEPRFQNVPTRIADEYVLRKLSAGTLKWIGKGLPVSESTGQQLGSALSLESLSVSLASIATSLEQVVALPALKKLTIETTELTASQCSILSQFSGHLTIEGVDTLSNAMAEILSRQKGQLVFYGLTEISDCAATYLCSHEGDLWIDLYKLPESAAQILRQHPSFSQLDDYRDENVHG